MKFDSGLSAGRNYLVSWMSTEFVVIMDDDMIWEKTFNVKRAIDILKKTNKTILTGGTTDRDAYSKLLYQTNGELHMCPALEKNKLFPECFNTDIGLNILIANRKFLQQNKWDEHYKIGEHELFFLNVKKKAPDNVIACPKFRVIHENSGWDKDKTYLRLRNRAQNNGLQKKAVGILKDHTKFDSTCQQLKISNNKCKPVSLNNYKNLRNGKNNFLNWKPTSFKTCAVVGSGASLLESKCGASIDAHDAVFRINGAPTAGFVKEVGSVRTFDVSYSPHCSRVSRQLLANAICVHGGGGEEEMRIFNKMKADAKIHYKKYSYWREVWKKFTKLKNPDNLYFYQHATMKALSNYKLKGIKAPTSGLVAILSAFDMCESVDIYGFDFVFGKKYKKIHYYDLDENEINLSTDTPHHHSREGELLKQYILNH